MSKDSFDSSTTRLKSRETPSGLSSESEFCPAHGPTRSLWFDKGCSYLRPSYNFIVSVDLSPLTRPGNVILDEDQVQDR